MSALLTLDGVSVRRGARTVLDQLRIEVATGELVALVGANGAGKTTLLRAAAGLLAPAAGRVTLGGADVARLDRGEIARRAAFLPQGETGEGLEASVEEIVALGRLPHARAGRGDRAVDRAAVERALAACALAELRDARLARLSAGERQRALVARCVAQEAPLWLLDEPTANLDPRHALKVMALVRERVSSGGAALVAMHDLALAARVADRVVVLSAGRVLADGTPAETLVEAVLEPALGLSARVEVSPDGAVSLRIRA